MMHPRLDPRAAELFAKVFSAFAVAAGLVGLFGIEGPIKWGFAIAAVASAFWSWRQKLPTAQELALCVFITLTVIFGIAWQEAKTSNASYDFVVTPYKAEVTTESWSPTPEHQARDAGLHGYGEHVRVECIAENECGELWYGLPDGNYILAEDLSPSPRTHGDPPSCD